jgi:hypothetical protein
MLIKRTNGDTHLISMPRMLKELYIFDLPILRSANSLFIISLKSSLGTTRIFTNQPPELYQATPTNVFKLKVAVKSRYLINIFSIRAFSHKGVVVDS